MCDAVGEELLNDQQLVGISNRVGRARVAVLDGRMFMLDLDGFDTLLGEGQAAHLHDVQDAIGKATTRGLLEDELGRSFLGGGGAGGGPDRGSYGSDGR